MASMAKGGTVAGTSRGRRAGGSRATRRQNNGGLRESERGRARDTGSLPSMERRRSHSEAVASGAGPAPKSILLHTDSFDLAGIGRSDAMHQGSKAVNDDSDYSSYYSNPVLAPLLKYVPKHIDLQTIKKHLKDVHPSAFGAYRTKEAWRRENSDSIHIRKATPPPLTSRRGGSCPVECNVHQRSPSPSGSVSSLADAESETSSSASPHCPSPLRSYLSTPTDHSLRRRLSSSSFASVCTCASTSSRSSSIRFAPLPEEELRSRERPAKSLIMGIAGRAKLMTGKLTEDDTLQFQCEDGAVESFDSVEGGEVANSTLTYNNDGKLVENRPLGVTLEEVRHLHFLSTTSYLC